MRGMIACALAAVLAGDAASDSRADEPRPPRSRPITIDVDASEVSRRIIHARLVIPSEPGPSTLLYPRWIPGEHGPTGPITDLAGFRITSGGKAISWRRDEA